MLKHRRIPFCHLSHQLFPHWAPCFVLSSVGTYSWFYRDKTSRISQSLAFSKISKGLERTTTALLPSVWKLNFFERLNISLYTFVTTSSHISYCFPRAVPDFHSFISSLLLRFRLLTNRRKQWSERIHVLSFTYLFLMWRFRLVLSEIYKYNFLLGYLNGLSSQKSHSLQYDSPMFCLSCMPSSLASRCSRSRASAFRRHKRAPAIKERFTSL